MTLSGADSGKLGTAEPRIARHWAGSVAAMCGSLPLRVASASKADLEHNSTRSVLAPVAEARCLRNEPSELATSNSLSTASLQTANKIG
jgi:hypothetical protein